MGRALLDSGDIRESITLANGSKRLLKMVSKLYNYNSQTKKLRLHYGKSVTRLGWRRESVTLTNISNQIAINT